MPYLERFFIQRPHAVEQFRERANYPRGTEFSKIENDLRDALEDAEQAGFLPSRHDGEFVARIALPKRNVVYALIEPGRSDGKYKYLVTTVYTQEMYQEWNKEGKVTTLGSLKNVSDELNRIAPQIKPTLFLRYKNGTGKMTELGEYLADEVGERIRKLIRKGVDVNNIEIFKRIPFKLDVSVDIQEV